MSAKLEDKVILLVRHRCTAYPGAKKPEIKLILKMQKQLVDGMLERLSKFSRDYSWSIWPKSRNRAEKS